MVVELDGSWDRCTIDRARFKGEVQVSTRRRMFVFISYLTVPAEDQLDLERHFHERSRLVDSFPGFLYLQLLRPQAGQAAFAFLTAWESREAFAAYMRSDEHAVSHSREPGEIMSRSSARHEAFEVVIDSRAGIA